MSLYALHQRPRHPASLCAACHRQVTDKRALTPRQRAIYAYLAARIDRDGYAPSFEEIAERFGYHSLATVHEHLSNLERKGWIRRVYNASRAIELCGDAEPVMSERLAELSRICEAYRAVSEASDEDFDGPMETFMNTFDSATIAWLIEQASRVTRSVPSSVVLAVDPSRSTPDEALTSSALSRTARAGAQGGER